MRRKKTLKIVPIAVERLVLLASYPASSADLSGLPIEVAASIVALAASGGPSRAGAG